jgi:hypothetical protein
MRLYAKTKSSLVLLCCGGAAAKLVKMHFTQVTYYTKGQSVIQVYVHNYNCVLRGEEL